MEIWDIYDRCMNKTGRTHARGADLPEGDYHLTVHIWPYDESGRVLIQKRSETVQFHPGKWAPTGGSVLAGETMYVGMRRELCEELGIDADKCEKTLLFVRKRENSFLGVYIIAVKDSDKTGIALQKEEVADIKWVTKDELSEMISSDNFFLRINYTDILFNEIGQTFNKET